MGETAYRQGCGKGVRAEFGSGVGGAERSRDSENPREGEASPLGGGGLDWRDGKRPRRPGARLSAELCPESGVSQAGDERTLA